MDVNLTQLKNRRDHLKRVNERLLNELISLDQLMRAAGFTNGLETVKMTAQYMIDEDSDLNEIQEDLL